VSVGWDDLCGSLPSHQDAMAAPYHPSDAVPDGYRPGAAKPAADDGGNDMSVSFGPLDGAY
jgi:hypothetical protein